MGTANEHTAVQFDVARRVRAELFACSYSLSSLRAIGCPRCLRWLCLRHTVDGSYAKLFGFVIGTTYVGLGVCRFMLLSIGA